MNKQVPIVAIVGRTNVGKSSLLNACVGFRRAIVAREAGTTRDSVAVKASHNEQEFWLIDTAGLKPAQDEFEATIQDQIQDAATSANVIWVAVDHSLPITDEDRQVAKLALKTKKPVLLVLNKCDKKLGVESYNEWSRLGIARRFLTSATQNQGISEILTATAKLLPKSKKTKTSVKNALTILGRPNAGKSSLFNALAKKQQALISDRAGTTRDVIKLSIRFRGQEIELADTAGIRRNGKIESGIERFSVVRAIEAIEGSDLALLVMDQADAGTHLDQKIAGLVADAGKGLILVVSKWDLAENKSVNQSIIANKLANDFVFIPWVPLVFTSAINGLNITKLFELAAEISAVRRTRLSTPSLNRWLREAVDSHPPAGLKNKQPKLRYITQENDHNPPSFKIFGSQTKYLHWSYKRYLERSFRKQWPFAGTPLKFWFIEKAGKR